MMSIIYIFWMYVILFAMVGGMRGWAKELLVIFSVILALALNHVIFKYIPPALNIAAANTTLFFWIRTVILLVLVFFGYQTVVSIQRLAARAAREKLGDTLLGIGFGAINGYLIAGTILYYLHIAKYPYPKVISSPPDPSALMDTVNQYMLRMPPQLLGEPLIYFAVILAFIFVIVVYI